MIKQRTEQCAQALVMAQVRFDRAAMAGDFTALQAEGDRIATLSRTLARTPPRCPTSAALHIGFTLQRLERLQLPGELRIRQSLILIQRRFMAGRCSSSDITTIRTIARLLMNESSDEDTRAVVSYLAGSARGAAHWRRTRPGLSRLAWILACLQPRRRSMHLALLQT